MSYDYNKAVLEDVKQEIEDNYDLNEWRGRKDEFEEQLNDDLWTDDSVTGNASGSYTFSTYEAEENLSHNWDLICAVANEYGYEPTISDSYEKGAEWWDVSIRCFLLSSAIAEALEELDNEGAFDELEEE